MDKIKVFCTFRQVGFHCWPKAPKEYKYLRSLHRHEFHVRVEVLVSGDNRAVEFIALKEEAKNDFRCLGFEIPENGMITFQSRSCEQLAIELQKQLVTNFQVTAIEVSEDGENGARVEFGCE